MKFFKLLIVLSIIATVFVGCNDEEPDTKGPTIEITNIADNREFKFGDNLTMKFKFTDETGIYEYKYEIYAKDFTKESFTAEKHIILEGFFSELSESQSVQLPERTPTVSYQEGDYLIKVQASDINQRVSTYYKPIKITYPVE